MTRPTFLVRAAGAATILLSTLAVTASPAWALSSSISAPTPADPVAGENVSFTVAGVALDSTGDATFRVIKPPYAAGSGTTPYDPYDTTDVLASFTSPPYTGQQQPSQYDLQVQFAAAGSQTVKGRVIDAGQGYADSATAQTFTVWPAMAAAIAPVAGAPQLGTPVTLTATGSGGKPGLTYAWDLNDDGVFTDAAGATTTQTFTGIPGPRTIRVRVRDAASPAHTKDATTIVTLSAAATTPAATTPAPVVVTPPPAVVKTTPAPAPAGCTKQASWALVEIITTGCFTKNKAGDWTTTSPVTVNGVALTPTATTPFIATPGTTAKPGGRIQLKGAAIQLKDTTVFRGDLDWSLPGGKQGGEADVATFSAPGGAKFYGFPIDGTITPRIGWNAAGRRYVNFPVNLGLPAIFKAGPDSKSPGISSKIVLSVDKTGVRNDGFKLQAANAYLGKLKVESVCFAFAPAGQTAIDGCQSPTLDGKPYLTCNENTNADRWSGSAVVILPTESKTRLAAFGSVADSRLASLGGFVDNLGKTVPLATGVYLNRIGVGLCINPPPFKLRGDVGIAILPPPSGQPTVAINGYFLYTDAYNKDPWSLELGGSVYVFGKQIGSGKVIIKGSGSLDFEVNVGLDLGPVNVAGGVSGWVEPLRKKFLVQGYIKGCLWVVCARADALASNIGLAGCVDLGSITYWTLERDSDWAWYAWWRLHWVTHVTKLKGGFGYGWQSQRLDLLGSSCDFGPWTPSRNGILQQLGDFQALGLPSTTPPPAGTPAEPGTSSQVSGDGIDIAEGAPAVALKITGAGGPPKLQVTGPDGSTISSPADAHSAQVEGKWIIVENPLDNTTNLILMSPKAGRWTIAAQAGSPGIATIEQSGYEGTPQVVGGIGSGKGTAKLLNVGFTIPSGSTLSLDEVGTSVQQTIAADVKPGTCPEAAEKSPGGVSVKCAALRFTPADGPGGKRSIYATITRDGMPLSRQLITTYTAKGWTIPSRPVKLRLRRVGSVVTIGWSASANAATYSVTVTGTDGTKTGFDLAGKCRAVKLRGVAKSTKITASVYGVRKDATTGKARTATLKAGAKSAGRKVTVRPLCH